MKALEVQSDLAAPGAGIPMVRIAPPSRWPSFRLREVWAYRELLYFLVWRDIKVRYKQTAIGAGWALIQPLMTMVVFTVVFAQWAALPSDGLPYPVFNFAALLPWTLFSRGLSQSVLSVVSNAHLVTKIYFPRLLLPLSSVLPGLLDFALALLILFGMIAWYGLSPGWGLLALPLFVLLVLMTALAISLWLSVINVRYRDVGQGIPLIIQLWMFASPVAYPLSMVPEEYRLLYSLNPMAGIISGFRWALLGTESPPVGPLIVSISVVFVLFVAGVAFFNRMESKFADVV